MGNKVFVCLSSFLFLFSFVLAASSSEINISIILDDDVVAGATDDSSVSSVGFWDVYGDYIAVIVFLLIVFVLWRKGQKKTASVSKSKRRARRKSRK